MDDLQTRSSEAPNMESRPSPKAPTSPTETDQTDPSGNSRLSFRVVEPAAISVKDLTVHVDPAPSPFTNVRALFRKGKDADIQQKSQRKTILNRVTVWMPSGSLTAIMGASGSGKTSLHPHFYVPTSIC